MSRPPDGDKKAEAKELFDAGESITAIADTLGVSRRTVTRWADSGAWREQRGYRKPQRKVVPIQQEREPKESKPYVPRRKRTVNELEAVEDAICNLADALDICTSERDFRSIGGCASGLCKLIELKLKLKPRTVSDLASQAIEMGVSPDSFMRELATQWQQRA